MDNDSTSLDVVRTLRRHALLILLCVVVTAVAAFALSRAQTKEYQASASVDFHDPQANEVAAGLSVAPVDHPVRIDTDLKLATLPRIADATAAAIGGGVTPGSVQSSVLVTKEADSDLATVTATSASPALAARLANTYAAQIAADRQRASQAYYGVILRSLESQIGALPPALQSGTQGSDLRSRADSLQVLSQLQGSSAQVVDLAGVPSSPSSPQVGRNTALGAILGLLLGLALALLLGRFDRRIREPGELADVYDVPLIGAVPYSSALKLTSRRPAVQGPPAAVAETFALMWARIRYFNVDRQLDTLLVTSAESGEGKTTIAQNLALAAAKVGARVLLVECDLRRPSLARQLGVKDSPGISDVLLEGRAPEDAVQTVEIGHPSGRQPQLDVLVAGGLLPPDPAHVLESDAMQTLLDRARSVYDFVLIDAPALAVVSDAFPLLRQADGVVIVGRLGRSRSDIAARLRETLAGANAALIGVIANGYRRRPGAAYARDQQFAHVSGRQASNGGVPTNGAVRLAQSDEHDQVTRR